MRETTTDDDVQTPLRRFEQNLNIDGDRDWINKTIEGQSYALLKIRTYAQKPAEECYVIDADRHPELSDPDYFERFQSDLLSTHFFDIDTDLRFNQRLLLMSDRPAEYAPVVADTSLARKHVGTAAELQQLMTPVLVANKSPMIDSVVAPETLDGEWAGRKVELRRATLIGGPNASGKSELSRAIATQGQPTVHTVEPPFETIDADGISAETLAHLLYRFDEKGLIHDIQKTDEELRFNDRPFGALTHNERKVIGLAINIIQAHRDPEGVLVLDSVLDGFDDRHIGNLMRVLRQDVAAKGTQVVVTCRKPDRASFASNRLSSLGDEYEYINMGPNDPGVKTELYENS